MLIYGTDTTERLIQSKIRLVKTIEIKIMPCDIHGYFSWTVQIDKLEKLDHLSHLSVLRLGKNKLSNREDVLYLRRLPNLRTLSLAGNPLCQIEHWDDYVKVRTASNCSGICRRHMRHPVQMKRINGKRNFTEKIMAELKFLGKRCKGKGCHLIGG